MRRLAKIRRDLDLHPRELVRAVAFCLCATSLCCFASIFAISARAEDQAQRSAKTPACIVSASFWPSARWFSRTASHLLRGEPVTIVAIGSSSTAGAGASSSAASYPGRLEVLLRERFHAVPIRVLNRGVNGELTTGMLARFDKDVVADHPDLVLWQVGTNAVLRDPSIAVEASPIRKGIEQLKATGADVVLIDPQYAPKVIVNPQAPLMVDLIGFEARDEGAGVFRRFALMREWYEVRHMPFDIFISADGLHMNDWGYDCIARNLVAAIIEAADAAAISPR
jgi:acyl-CoA thioesterase I